MSEKHVSFVGVRQSGGGQRSRLNAYTRWAVNSSYPATNESYPP